MKRFLACYGDYRRLLAVVLIGSVLSAVLETLFPMVVRHILDVVLPSGNLADLFRYGLGLLGLYIVLDGRDIRDYTLASLRQAVGIVQQLSLIHI